MPHDPEDVQDSDQREGRYANDFQVGHNAVACLLDFGQRYAAHGTGQLHARIITNSADAKGFAALFQQALAQYEQAFGPLPEAPETEGV
jgi:hypothetical protein